MITTDITVNNIPVATSAGEAATGVSVLDSASVTWGRGSALDQPAPASASFRVLAHTAADLDRFAPGYPVTITSTSDSPAPDQKLIDSPDLLHAYMGGTVAGSRFIQNSQLAAAIIPPAAFAPDTPAAWDHVPRAGSDPFRLSASVDVPAGSSIFLHAVIFSAPSADVVRFSEPLAILHPKTPGTVRLEGTFIPQAADQGKYIGIGFTTIIGKTFDDVPATFAALQTTWEETATALFRSVSLSILGKARYVAEVFTGRISSATVTYDSVLKKPVISVSAVDEQASWQKMKIGADPWNEEAASERVKNIMTAARSDSTLIFDKRPSGFTLAAQDIDAANAGQLLADVATSTGTVLWYTSHPQAGDIIRFEDPQARKALYYLRHTPGADARIETEGRETLEVPAGVLEREKIELSRDPSNLATTVTVTWADKETDDKGEQRRVDRRVIARDDALISERGYHDLSVSTDLTSQANALALAYDLLARSNATPWQLSGITWDTRAGGVEKNIITILSSYRRCGLPLIFTDLPGWIPGNPGLPAYLDGGTYRLERGRWILELMTTTAARGSDSIPWEKVPATLDFEHTPQTFNELSAVTI